MTLQGNPSKMTPRTGARPRLTRRCPPTLERLETRTMPSFIAASAYPVGTAPRGVTYGDFNNDGVWDLATANHDAGTVSVLLGDGAGSFGQAHDFATGAGPVAVAA